MNLAQKKIQGRIRGDPCRGRLSRGNNESGSNEYGWGRELDSGSNHLDRGIKNHEMLISELSYPQTAQKCKKMQRPDRPTDTVTYRSRCPRLKEREASKKKRTAFLEFRPLPYKTQMQMQISFRIQKACSIIK